jgi:hypothetical protein
MVDVNPQKIITVRQKAPPEAFPALIRFTSGNTRKIRLERLKAEYAKLAAIDRQRHSASMSLTCKKVRTKTGEPFLKQDAELYMKQRKSAEN